MKIVAIAMLRNEADIVETFVRYCLAFCDEMIVTNHRSGDGCSEILEAIAEEEPRVRVTREIRSGYFQQEFMTRMLHQAARELKADWVFPVDADEFLLSTDGSDVRAAIEGLPTDLPVRVPWRTYVPRAQDEFQRGNVLASIQHRRVREQRAFYKVLVPGPLACNEKTRLIKGNHHLLDTSKTIQPKIRSQDTPRLAIGHFPVRSSLQIVKRHVIGYLASLCLGLQEDPMAYNQRALYSRLRTGANLSPEELMDMAYAYPHWEAEFPSAGELVLDPIPYDAARIVTRYDDKAVDNQFLALATFAEEMAREMGALRTEQIASTSESQSWFMWVANRHRLRRHVRRSRIHRAPLEKP